MAANKRKIQANAQKYLQKGQLDRALKEYLSLIQLDPRDSNSRLKTGDIFLRQGDKDKAAEAYIKVAEQFMKDGFDAKSVAIYKQVGKIDPERLDIFEPLAELYQRLGLTSEALAALQTAADAYNKEGRKRDALELLRKMATLDPTNTTSRLKIADLLRQAEMEDDALSEYIAVAEELERQGARDELVAVYDRVLELEPERVSTLVALTRILVDQGPPERAQPYAERLVAASPDAPDGHEFLASIHTALGREDAAQSCYRTLAEVYRRTGDDERSREISQRIFGSELSTDGTGEGAGGDLSDLPIEPEASEPDEDLMEQTLDLSGADAAFSADSEQLLAEASVYLRYGKADRAIATLETLLSTEPDHRGALEKLGEAHAEHGDPAKAVTIWVRAAEIARVEDDEQAFATLRERIRGLDAAAAERLGGGESGSAPVDETPAAPAAPAAPEVEASGAEAADEVSLDGDEVELAIDLGEEEIGEDVLDDGPSLEEDDAGEEIELDLDEDLEFDVVDDDESLPAPSEPSAAEQTVLQAQADATVMQGGPDATVMQPTGEADVTIMQADDDDPAAQTGSGSTTTPQQIAEHLEEADFYFEQNLFDEAEALYNKVVEAAPQHPQAMLRLGEIAARRGEDPAAAGLEAEAAPADERAADAAVETPEAAADDEDAAHEEDLVDWEDEVEIETGGDAAAADDDEEIDLDLDVDLDDGPGLQAESGADEPDEDAETAVADPPQASADAEETDPELAADAAEATDDIEIEFDSGLDDEEETAASLEPPVAEPDPDDETGVALEFEASEPDGEELTEEEPLAAAEEDATDAADAEVDERAAVEEQAFELDDDVEPDETIQVEKAAPEAPPEPLEEPVAAQPATASEEPLESPADETAAEEPEEEGDDASFDLAAELSDVFDGDEQSDAAATDGADDGFDAIFREFKKGVKEQLSDGDFEAHYDLGIAYREMGLLDDAVGEFRTALGSGELKLPALHMLGLCALDQNQAQDAASHFEQALSLPSIPEQQQAALRFDLGRALQESGDSIRARAAFQAVSDIDPDYQDVAERLAALETGDGAPAQPDVETFESFDDLIAEAESVLGDDEPDDGDDDGEPGGSVELDLSDAEEADSFGEAEAIVEPDETLLEAVVEPERAEAMVEADETLPPAEPLELEFEAEPEVDADPEPEPEPEPEPKRRRRKKISF